MEPDQYVCARRGDSRRSLFVWEQQRSRFLVCYSIKADGLLETVSWTLTKGHHPRNFSIHPSGQVIVLNADTDSCVVLKLNPATYGVASLSELHCYTHQCHQHLVSARTPGCTSLRCGLCV